MKLWNKTCHRIILYNLKTIKDVYNRYSGRFADPGDKTRYMSCPEFIELIDTLQILADAKQNDTPKKQRGKQDTPGSNSKSSKTVLSALLMHSVKEVLISNTIDALDSEAVASEAFVTPQKNSKNKARDLENHSSVVSRQSSTGSLSSSPSRIIDSGTLFSRDVPNIYFTSLMTRVDELSAEKHINMQLVEFIEALARIADKANLEPQIRAQNTLR